MFKNDIRHLARAASVVVLAFLAVACQSRSVTTDPRVLRIGASAVPHEEILRHIAPRLAEAGITLRTVVMQDYVQPNLRVDAGDLDANFFQTAIYFEDFKQRHGVGLVSAGSVHVEPFALYAEKFPDAGSLPDGARVAVPADASNQHRAMMLLAQAGLVTLPAGDGERLFGIKDVVSNPKKLKFLQVEAAMTPRMHADVDVAGINANFALAAGLHPQKDGLVVERAVDGPYANIVAIRQSDTTHPAIVALMAALQSEQTRDFITERYRGAILPLLP